MPDVQQIESPECERLCQVAPDSQKIGAFLEWLKENGYSVAKWIKRHPHLDEELVPARIGTNELLAEYYSIDLDKVENERRAILAKLRGE